MQSSTFFAAQPAPRVDRPPPTLSYASPGSMPATQGQRSKEPDRLWRKEMQRGIKGQYMREDLQQPAFLLES